MRKVAMFSLALILLAATVVPVMAAGNHGNGNGNGGQGNTTSEQARERNQDRHHDHVGNGNNGLGGNGNHGQGRMRTPFYLQGEISAIDATAKTVTILVTHGNAQVKEFVGSQTPLVVEVTDATMYFKITQGEENEDGGNRVAITFADLAVGQMVAIHGNVVDGKFVARLITVYIKTPVGEQENATP